MKFLKFTKKYWFWFVIAAFCLTPVIWFWGRSGVLINGLDTNFPLNPLIWFKRRFFVWYDLANAGSDFSSSMSGIFFHLIQTIPYLLGLKLQAVETISLIVWFSFVVLSALAFIKSTGIKAKGAWLIFVLVYSFNIYLFNTWENVKVSNLAFYVSLPLFLSLMNFYRKKIIPTAKLFIYSFLASIIASGAGINPAYFIALLLGIFVYSFVVGLIKANERKLVIRGLLVIVGTLLAANLYWILPLINYLFFQSKILNLADIGLTNWLDSLSVNTSLLNVLRLQGAWDWYSLDTSGQPLYLPYTLNYFRKLPFILFSFVLPTIAILSFAAGKTKENIEFYLCFGIFLLLGVFMGAGTHPPTGFVYSLLVQKIPFFSFFRSPWYIFTPYLIFAYAGLAALLFTKLEKLRIRFIVYGLTFLFVIGYLLYSYPLVTGKIFRPSRIDGFYVKFPDYVWEVEKWLQRENNGINGRIITYPDDQVENFSWGYKGTDTILSLFSTHEFITPSFNLASKPLQDLLDEFYSSIKRKNYTSAFSIMRFLGADTIFNRKNFISLSPKIDENDAALVSGNEKTDIGEWSFLRVGENRNVSKIFSPSDYFLDYFHDKGPSYLAKITGGIDVLSANPFDTEFSKTPQNRDAFLILQEAENKTVDEDPTNNVQKFILDIPERGSYRLFLEKKSSFSKDTELAGTFVVVDSSTGLSGIDYLANKEFIVFGPIELGKGAHNIEIHFPIFGSLVRVNDVSAISDYGSLRSEELPQDKSKTVVAFSSDQEEKKILIPVSDFDPFRRYVLSFDYKYFYGKVPIFDIIQSAPGAPVKTFPDYVGSSFDWERKTVTVNPVPVESKLEIFILLPANIKKERSKTFIENLSFLPILDNKLFALEEKAQPPVETNQPEISFYKKSSVKYSVDVKGGEGGYYLVFLENYSSGWKLSSKDIYGEPIHFTANGYANGWYIPGGKEDQNLTIYFAPQRLFYYGASFFGFLLAAVIVICLKNRFRKS